MSWFRFSGGSKISPVVLYIIVLVAVVLFVAALVHLLVRCLSGPRPPNSRDFPGGSTAGAVQRQLQQLFHLHDSGLEQTSIDALPVFSYEDVLATGSKGPFDCAVCLCEFTEQDRLRLLPSCSHAFHVECIDTWLLSNSSCPLCRGAISSSGLWLENPFLWFEDSGKDGSGNLGIADGGNDDGGAVISGRRVFSVRLGKFRNVNGNSCNNDSGENQEIEAGESSNFNGGSDLDGRRCFSMGSFQYVVADMDMQVELCASGRGRGGGHNGNFIFDGVRGGGGGGDGGVEGNKIYSGGKGESFSVSKIWLWSKKDKDKFPSLP